MRQHKKLAAFIGGDLPLPKLGNTKQYYCILFAKNRRDTLFWKFYQYPLIEDCYLDFCQKLLNANLAGFVLALQFAGLSYAPKLATWVEKNNQLLLIKGILNSTPDLNIPSVTYSSQ